MYMRFPGGKKKALTFSYDDGVEQDIRLMEILNRNGLKATFNINGCRFEQDEYTYEEGRIHRPMGRKQALEVYGGELGKNHEIAIHSYSHPYLDHMPRAVATAEIIKHEGAEVARLDMLRFVRDWSVGVGCMGPQHFPGGGFILGYRPAYLYALFRSFCTCGDDHLLHHDIGRQHLFNPYSYAT